MPPEVLRERLAAARSGGVSFDEAWPVALAAAVNTAWEREEWRDILSRMVETWRAAWEREEWRDILSRMVETWRAAWERRDASRPESALLMLVRPGGARLPEGACAHCQCEIPPERGKRGARPLYCSYRCARRAAYRRERERAAA